MTLKRKSRDPGKTGASPALQKVIDSVEDEIVKALFIGGGGGEEPPESKQLREGEQPFAGIGGVISPPINFDLWARMMEMNTRLGRAIRTYARNTAGLGWEVVSKQPITPDTDEETRKEIKRQTAEVKRLFEHPNRQMPYVTLSFLEKMDEEAIGNGYIEVTRNLAGKINGLFHVSGVTVRRKKGGGFVQVRDNKTRFFKEFGDKRIVDPETGETLVDEQGRRQGKEAFPNGLVPLARRATELLHFRVYSPRSSFYGLPRYMATAPAITGNRLAAIRNVAFFSADAVPRLIITVSGGRLTGGSIEMLEKFVVRKGKVGPEGAHRIAVLQTEERQVGIGPKPIRTQIQVTPLTVGSTEDASFQNYRRGNDEEIREAFGLAQIYFTADQVNKSCLTGDTQIPLLDGRTLTFEELVRQYGERGSFWVYSIDRFGRVVPGRAHHPRLAKAMAEVWEVLLDNGEVVRGTPDHLFMRREGGYLELASLRQGIALKPLYRSVRPIAYGKRPYWWYSTSGMRKPEPVHRMAARFKHGGPLPAGYEVHHPDDSLNNNPEMIQVLSPSAHAVTRSAERWRGMTASERLAAVQPMLQASRNPVTLEDLLGVVKTEKSWSASARRLGVDVLTLRRRVAEAGIDPREFTRQHFPNWRGQRRLRKDATLERLLEAAPRYKTMKDVAKGLGWSEGLLRNVLRRAGWEWSRVAAEFLGAAVGCGENHRVMRVRRVGLADVYDLTVDEHSNFALKAGVFVHNSALATADMTERQEFEPDRIEKEFIVNATVVVDILAPAEPLVEFRLKRPPLTDPLDQSRIDQVYASLGALTPNELRERIGKPRFPSNFSFADKPLQVALTELSLGAAIAIRGVTAPTVSAPIVSGPAAGVAVPAVPLPAGATGQPPRAGESVGAPVTPQQPKELDFVLEIAGDARRFAERQLANGAIAAS